MLEIKHVDRQPDTSIHSVHFVQRIDNKVDCAVHCSIDYFSIWWLGSQIEQAAIMSQKQRGTTDYRLRKNSLFPKAIGWVSLAKVKDAHAKMRTDRYHL